MQNPAYAKFYINLKTMELSANKIIVILGPTSAGKSAVAIRLAKKFDGEIISVDSRQIYRGMNLGTGKVDGRFLADSPPSGRTVRQKKVFISENIPHHMIDIVSPRTNFSAAQFKKKADRIIVDILKRGKLPILCGGTGFWIKSIVDDITYPEVKPDWDLRKKLEKKEITELIQELKKLDPRRAENIDAKNKARLIRAIEICKILGKVPSLNLTPALSLTRRGGNMNEIEFLQIGISVPKEKLHEKIKNRLDQRWKDGMIEEVNNLREKYKLSWKKIQSFGLGYFWIPEYLQEKITLKELYEKVYLAEKDYAKRQMTWFSKDTRIKWIEKYEDMEKEIAKFLIISNP